MARAKYQVLVIPYHIENGNVKYCIFKRNDMKVWQFIAGGGEDEDETIIISAKREAYEEANIGMDCKYSVLDTQNSIPTYCFKEAKRLPTFAAGGTRAAGLAGILLLSLFLYITDQKYMFPDSFVFLLCHSYLFSYFLLLHNMVATLQHFADL